MLDKIGSFQKNIISFQKNIVSFILEPEFKGAFLYLKTIFIIISILLVGGIILFLFINTWLKRFVLEDLIETFTTRPYGAKKAFKEWAKIQKKLESEKIDEYKLALIEADGLLDNVLEIMGYQGDTIGDRLKKIDLSILPNKDEVLEAHRVRNNVVHDPDYNLTLEVTKRALAIYEKALRDLEAF